MKPVVQMNFQPEEKLEEMMILLFYSKPLEDNKRKKPDSHRILSA
jgi:hypothetical protein